MNRYSLKYNEILSENYIVDTETEEQYFLSDTQDANKILQIINNQEQTIKTQKKEISNEKERLNRIIQEKRSIRNQYHQTTKDLKDLKLKIVEGFPYNAEPIKAPQRLDLREYFRYDENKPKPYKYGTQWDAGDELKALIYYKTDEVEYLNGTAVGEYQGTYYAIFKVKDYFFIWRSDFGSCEGCDWFCGKKYDEGFESFKTSLAEGNTLQFYSEKHALYYLETIKKSNRYNYWKGFPIELIKNEMSQDGNVTTTTNIL